MPTESESKARLDVRPHATVVWGANGDGVMVQPDTNGHAFVVTGQNEQHPLDVVPAYLDPMAVLLLAWVLLADVDKAMTVAVYVCGECGGQGTHHSWERAWGDELRLRKAGQGRYAVFHGDDYGENFGLDDRMVCPRCKYVHSDDEGSFVDEIKGRVVAVDP